jgi:1-deoxy-D-xylulose-5-phosphate reductoisomerase
MKHLYLLGAAGSIGLQTLDVIEKDSSLFKLVGVSLSHHDAINDTILNRFDIEIACLRHHDQLIRYQEKYPHIRFVSGDEGLMILASYPTQGLLINALSGSTGLMPTVTAIQSGKDIALANKETLVMAGDLINELVKSHHVHLYPIDSEHSAIWQVLKGESIDDIDHLVITASGGSFRDLSREELHHVTIDQALQHPNWSMGSKITIDSATMMNKGLEVIEAHHLFHLPYDKIQTVLHRESVVHGLVYFKDGTIKASLSLSDMRIPIAYALHYPNRTQYPHQLDLVDLHFSPMDYKRYPLLELAYRVGKEGGLLPTVMNASNEAAVKLFLQGKISFLEIERLVIDTVQSFKNQQHPTLQTIIQTDQDVQQELLTRYEKR